MVELDFSYCLGIYLALERWGYSTSNESHRYFFAPSCISVFLFESRVHMIFCFNFKHKSSETSARLLSPPQVPSSGNRGPGGGDRLTKAHRATASIGCQARPRLPLLGTPRLCLHSAHTRAAVSVLSPVLRKSPPSCQTCGAQASPRKWFAGDEKQAWSGGDRSFASASPFHLQEIRNRNRGNWQASMHPAPRAPWKRFPRPRAVCGLPQPRVSSACAKPRDPAAQSEEETPPGVDSVLSLSLH